MTLLPRLVLLTANGRRHRWLAGTLHTEGMLIGVVSEAKRSVVVAPADKTGKDAVDIAAHLAERQEVEQGLLGPAPMPDIPILPIPTGSINSTVVFDAVRNWKPDAIVLYGTGIVRPPLLTHFDGKVINLHLGLSPYYRGAATNFWPLVDRLPECVGATIHLAVAEVDAGPILGQIRPPARSGDRAHHLGTDALIVAGRALTSLVRTYLQGELQPVQQPAGAGKVFRRADFNAAALRLMWKHLESGMIDEYLVEQDARCAAYPIVDPMRGRHAPRLKS